MSKVISFIGGDSGTGTTMTAQSFAKAISLKKKKTLLISGSGKTGDEYLGGSRNCSIDDLKAGIKSGQIHKEDVFQCLIEEDYLSYLPAVRNCFTAKYYPENTFEILLADLKDNFDYIVVDGGDSVNSALTISAINVADERYFVVTQQLKSLSRFAEMRQTVLVPLELEGNIIVNKYQRDPALYLIKDLERMLSQKNIIAIPYVSYGWQAEMEGKTLLKHSGFSKAVNKIVQNYEPDIKKELIWKKSFA